jgi:DNA/RNA endonuclease YhcR with UshA esterase domain
LRNLVCELKGFVVKCPSCGRETPAAENCAHCGTSLRGRLGLDFLKWIVLLLAVAGVAALTLSASRLAVPQVAIGEIGATMNLAYVRISGVVSGAPKYDPDSGYLSFRVDDGTGELTVASYRAETQALISSVNVPLLGDHVTLEGALRLRDDSTVLTLSAPEHLVIERPAPVERAIRSLTADDAGTMVVIRGQVREIREPYAGLTIFTIGDGVDEVEAAISKDTVALTGPPPPVTVGDTVEAAGLVTLFRDSPQITLTSGRNLRPSTVPVPTADPSRPQPIAALAAGETVTVQGEVRAAESYAEGFKFTLRDETGEITLLLPEEVYSAIPGVEGLRPGATVQVTGAVNSYQGDLQITPPIGEAVTITAPGSPSTDPPTPINQIALAQVNTTLTVEGRIETAEEFSKGMRYTVKDESGSITLLLWQNVLKYVPYQLQPGARVRATGLIQSFGGAFEVMPQIGFDVTVIQ